MRSLLFLAIASTTMLAVDVHKDECHDRIGECAGDLDNSDFSLLQARTSESLESRAPAQEKDRYFVQVDGTTKTPVPRDERKGLVRPIFFKYPLTQGGIKVQGNKVFLSFSGIIQSEFSRDAETIGQEDYGFERAVPFKSLASMISDKVQLAFAEKSETFWMEKEALNYTEEKVRTEQKEQDWAEAMLARIPPTRDLRLSSLAALSMPLGGQIIASGKDQNHVQAIRDFAAVDGGRPSGVFLEAMKNSSRKLVQRALLRETRTPIRSSIGCLHFETVEGMTFTEDGVEVPLDTKITAYRGRLGFFPNTEYQLSSGIAVFTHNKETNSLDLFLGQSSNVDLISLKSGVGGNFAVGSVDGNPKKGPPMPEGRAASMDAPFFMQSLYNIAQGLPEDFTFLCSPREQVGCPDSVLATLSEKVGVVHDLSSGAEQANIFNVGSLVGTMWGASLDLMKCSVAYIRPVGEGHCAPFDIFAAVGLMHVLMEMPAAVMQAAFKDSSLWDTVPME